MDNTQLISEIMVQLVNIAADNSEHMVEEYDENDISDALEALYMSAQEA